MAFGFNLFADVNWVANGAVYQQGTWTFNKAGTISTVIDVTEWLGDAARLKFSAVTDTPLQVLLKFDGMQFVGYVDKLSGDFLIDDVQFEAETLNVEIKALEAGDVIYLSLEKEVTYKKQVEDIVEQVVPQHIHAAFFAESTAVTVGTTPVVILKNITEITDDVVGVVMITITGQSSAAQTLTIRLTNNGRDVTPLVKQVYSSAGYQTISANFLIPFEMGVHELIVWGNVDTGTFSIPTSGAVLMGLARNTKETVVGGMPIVTLAQEIEAYHRKIITEQQSTVSRQVPISSILEQSIFPTQITQITTQCDVTLSEG